MRRHLKALEAKRRLPASTKQLHANLALLARLWPVPTPESASSWSGGDRICWPPQGAGSGDGLTRAEAAFVAVARCCRTASMTA
ncbi:MAG: hypothetical protein ACR2LJ_09295 [Acidimicrobiales bacterium]